MAAGVWVRCVSTVRVTPGCLSCTLCSPLGGPAEMVSWPQLLTDVMFPGCSPVSEESGLLLGTCGGSNQTTSSSFLSQGSPLEQTLPMVSQGSWDFGGVCSEVPHDFPLPQSVLTLGSFWGSALRQPGPTLGFPGAGSSAMTHRCGL